MAATKGSPIVFCLALAVITSNGVSFVCASINAKISVSVQSTIENFNTTTAIIKTGDFAFNISSRASFFIIQAHSLSDRLHLSSDEHFGNKSTAVGYDIGLVQMVNSSADVFTFYLTGENNATDVLIAIQDYDDKAPIPGGCNMVHEPQVVPYQNIIVSDEMIEVDVQPAEAPGKLCEDAVVKLEKYHVFFTSESNDEAEYFDNVKKMMTVDGILKYGKKVGESTSASNLSRFFVNYKGIGEAFAVIARYGNSSSVYVPAATFGCNREKATCKADYYRVIPIVLLIAGYLATFTNKSITLGCNVAVLSVMVLYIMAEQIGIDPLYLALPVFVVFIGVFYVLFKKLKAERFVNACAAGILVGTWILNGIFSDTEKFKSDITYWMTIQTVTYVILTLAFYPFKNCTSSFTAIMYVYIGLSICWGGVVQYFYLYEYWRSIVHDFNYATIDPPNPVSDGLAFAATVSSCVIINFYKLCCCRNRNTSDETTPLLA